MSVPESEAALAGWLRAAPPDPASGEGRIRRPAPQPCEACPYRRDAPPRIWHPDQYRKLPRYDLDTPYQPQKVFRCHQSLVRVCGGWAGCHDSTQLLALRVAPYTGVLSSIDLIATIEYVSPVDLFASGTEAARHGLAPFTNDAARRRAQRIIDKVVRLRGLGDDGWLLINDEPPQDVTKAPAATGEQAAPTASPTQYQEQP